MAVTLPKTSFAAGLVGPEYHGRTEAPFYHEGVQVADNWEVLPSGAIRTRAGTKVILPVDTSLADNATTGLNERPYKLYTYAAPSGEEQDWTIILGPKRFRFLRADTLTSQAVTHRITNLNNVRVSQNGEQMIFTFKDQFPDGS